MATLLDFTRTGEWYSFTFSAPEDEFNQVLQCLKQIPLADRRWDPESKRWSVRCSWDTVLMRLFENGKCCVEVVESQLPLF